MKVVLSDFYKKILYCSKRTACSTPTSVCPSCANELGYCFILIVQEELNQNAFTLEGLYSYDPFLLFAEEQEVIMSFYEIVEAWNACAWASCSKCTLFRGYTKVCSFQKLFKHPPHTFHYKDFLKMSPYLLLLRRCDGYNFPYDEHP